MMCRSMGYHLEYCDLKKKFQHNISMKERINKDSVLTTTISLTDTMERADTRFKATKYLNPSSSNNFLTSTADKLSAYFSST